MRATLATVHFIKEDCFCFVYLYWKCSRALHEMYHFFEDLRESDTGKSTKEIMAEHFPHKIVVIPNTTNAVPWLVKARELNY